MGRADIEAPTIEEKEDLVAENEIETLPEMPELPAALDTALDTFIEQLDLQQSGPAEFVLGSALAATAERFGPSEAENLLARFDEEMTAEFFENLIDTGEIPQSPTMNNLLAGDVNSQAAQFILENLASQSASGAFITMQANRRDTSTQEERKRDAKGKAFSMALDIANGINAVTTAGLTNYDQANNDAARQQAYDQMVEDQYQLWLEAHPDANETQKEYMREYFEKFSQSEIVSKYAEQLANGEITVEQYNEKIRTLRDEFEQHPQLQQYVLQLDEINEDLAATEELLANAEALVASGNYASHLVTHYQGEVEELRQAQAEKVREMQEYRDSLEGQLSDLSLEALDARIAAEQNELQRMEVILDGLSQEVNQLEADTERAETSLAAYEAEVSAAHADYEFARTNRMIDEIGLGGRLTDLKDAAAELRETAGAATIRLQHVGDHVMSELPAALQERSFSFDIDFSATLEDGIDYVVQKDEAGQLFVNLHDGTRFDIPEWMESSIRTETPNGLSDANFTFAAFGETFTRYEEALGNLHSARGALEHSSDEEMTTWQRLHSVLSETDLKQAELDVLASRKTHLEEDLVKARAEVEANPDDESSLERLEDLETQVASLGDRITVMQDSLGQIKTTFGSVYDYGLSQMNLTSDSSLTGSSIFDTDTPITLGQSTPLLNSGNLNLNDPITLTSDVSTAGTLNLDYNFDLPSWELDPLNFDFLDDAFLTSLDYVENYLTDLDFSTVTSELDTLEADIDDVVNSVLGEDPLPEGIDREALAEAVRMDIEWNTENKVCRPVEESNVGKLLAAEGAEDFVESMNEPGTSFMGVNLQGMFNGMSKLSETMALAQRISMEADSAAADGRGERLVEASNRLQEINGGEEAVAAADTGAESEAAAMSPEYDFDADKAGELARTITGPISREEMELIAETAGIPLEKLETAIIDLAAAEPDRGIEIAEPIAAEEEPAPSDEPAVQIAEAAPSATNNNQTYDPMTLGA
ncbi:MAG: hypothetical protein JKY71_08360 [Alphaproteobacteria bacterium]|nr:hypothetical protein [Alphaproteobacteria bacterium]